MAYPVLRYPSTVYSTTLVKSTYMTVASVVEYNVHIPEVSMYHASFVHFALLLSLRLFS